MPEIRRPRTPRSLLVPVVAVLVASQLAWPALARAEEGTPSAVGAGDTVVGELVQAWAEHADPETAEEHADEGPLTWVETAEGEAVRIPTESIEDLPRAEVGATVSVTVGDEVADAAAAEDGVEPAREVLDATVVQAAPADVPPPTAAAGAVTHAVTVVMVVPAGAVADARPLQQVVDTVNGSVSTYWAGQSDAKVVIGVTASQDLRSQPLTARCDQPFPMWDEVARRIGWVQEPGRHLLLHVPADTPGCAAVGVAAVGRSLNGGGQLYVQDIGNLPLMANVVAHELGHNFGLGHASEHQCDSGLEVGTCEVKAYKDWYDVMGTSWNELGSLNAPHAARLGLLPGGERVSLTPSSASARYTLAPMASPSGTRALQLTAADGTVYWLEFRQSSGQDGWLGGPRNFRSLDQGVTVRRASAGDDTSLLLDGTPSARANWSQDFQVALPVAVTTPVARGEFRVTVESVGATATVLVSTGREAPRADPDGSSYLNAGESLSGDRELRSPNGRYRMAAQADGNVVVYARDGRVLWASAVWSPGARLDLQTDGNLVAYATDRRPVWDSRTWGSGATRLVMQDDGNLVLYRSDGRAVWSTGWDTPDRLRPGQQLSGDQALTSPNGRYRAVVQTDGNLVVQASDGRVLWASGVYTRYGRLVLQPDGNVVTYATNGRPVWDTRSWGNGSSQLVLQDDGNLVLYRADGRATWWTGWDTPDRLRAGQQLSADQALTSPSGRYRLVAQADGNVVVYTSTGRAVWASGTYWRGARLVQQRDGNLVSYAPDGRALWSTGTWWSPGALALVQDDGSLTVRRPDGATLWTTGPDRSP